MNNHEHKLNKLFLSARGVSLSSEENEVLHRALLFFMENTPVQEKTKIVDAQPSPLVMESTVARQYKHGGNMPSQLARNNNKSRMIIALLIAFGLTAGTSYAAQSTLPGDILYPVKIHLNENVESLVAIGAEADAEVKARHALKRLEEVAELKAEGRFNAETKAEAEGRFKDDVEEMDQDLDDMRIEGDTEGEIRIRGEFRKNAEKHMLKRSEAGTDVEFEIDLEELLDGDDQDEEEMEASAHASATSSMHKDDDENDEGDEGEDGDESDDSDKRGDLELRLDTEIKLNTGAKVEADDTEAKGTVTGGVKSTVGI